MNSDQRNLNLIEDRRGNSDFNKQNTAVASTKKGAPQLGFRPPK